MPQVIKLRRFQWNQLFTTSSGVWKHPFGIVCGTVASGKTFTITSLISNASLLFGKSFFFSSSHDNVSFNFTRKFNQINDFQIEQIIADQNTSETSINCLVYIGENQDHRVILKYRDQFKPARITVLLCERQISSVIIGLCDFVIIKNNLDRNSMNHLYNEMYTSINQPIEIFLNMITQCAGGKAFVFSRRQDNQRLDTAFWYENVQNINELQQQWSLQQVEELQRSPPEQIIQPEILVVHSRSTVFPESFLEQIADVETDQCQICFINKRSALLYDCGHAMYCTECLVRSTRGNVLACPCCRQRITQVIRMFF